MKQPEFYRFIVLSLTVLCLSSVPAFSQIENEETTELGKVIVTTTRNAVQKENVTQSIQVITKEDIEKTSALDITDVLKKTTGVDVIQYPGALSGVGMRGFRPEYSTTSSRKHTLLLINGRPAGASNLATIMLDNVERIEVLKGPASALYGSEAMGGVINVITKSSKGKLAASATLGGGSYKTWYAALNTGGSVEGLFDFDFSGKAYQQHGETYVGDDDVKDNFTSFQNGDKREDSSVKKYNSTLRVGKDFGNWRVDLTGDLFIGRDIYNPGAEYKSTPAPNLKDFDRYGGDLKVSGKILDLNKLTFTAYASQEDTNYKVIKADRDYYIKTQKWYGLSIVDTQSFIFGNHNMSLTCGLDYKNEKSESEKYDKTTFARIAPNSPNDRTDTLGLFGQAEASFMDELVILNTGVRYDRISMKLEKTSYYTNPISTARATLNSYNPNLGVKVKPYEFLNFHGTIGKAFVAPNPYQLAGYSTDVTQTPNTTTYGNADLDPESSVTYDCGVGGNLRKFGVSYDLTFFYTDVKDKITKKSISATDEKFFNADSAEMSGLEGEFSIDFGVIAGMEQSIRLFTNYTEMFKAEETIGGKTKEITCIADRRINVGLDYDDKKMLSMRLSYRYMGKYYENNRYKPGKPVEELDAFWVMDCSAGIKLGERHKINVKLSNIFDKYYYEKLGYGMPGRNIYADYTIKI